MFACQRKFGIERLLLPIAVGFWEKKRYDTHLLSLKFVEGYVVKFGNQLNSAMVNDEIKATLHRFFFYLVFFSIKRIQIHRCALFKRKIGHKEIRV